MKILLENWRKYLTEQEEGILEAARELLKNNDYLSKYAEGLTEQNLIDAGNYIFLYLGEGTFQHVKASHTRESDLPGSKFNDSLMTDEQLTGLIVDLLKKQPKPQEVDSSPYGTKFKWFNVEMGENVGLDSIIHKDDEVARGATPRSFDYKEKIGNNRGIPSIMSQGLKVMDAEGNILSNPEEADPEGTYYAQQDISVIDAPLQPTERLNLIVGDIGKIGSKSLINLITVFPGVSEPKAMNKKDYAELGYHFLTGKG